MALPSVLSTILRFLREWAWGRVLIVDREIWLHSRALSDQIRSRIDSTFENSGNAFPNSLGRGRAYRRALNWRNEFDQKLAIQLMGPGHFGNLVIQLANLIALTRLFPTSTAFFRADDDHVGQARSAPKPFSLDLIEQAGPTTMLPRRLIRSRHRQLAGISAIWQTSAMCGTRLFVEASDRDFEKLAFEIRSAFHVMIPSARIVEQVTDESCLTIHLRSGDVFSRNPHPKYGQPPWAFYRKVLEEAGNWSAVVVVAEDTLNPCFQKIESWCGERGIPFNATGQNFGDAFVTIGNAANLALSSGTFSEAVCALYPSKRQVFIFQAPMSPGLLSCQQNLTVIRDARGIYVDTVMNRRWTNSDAQNLLLRDYEGDLSFD